jgi:hypothetical protein
MPRYYFNRHDAQRLISDWQGTELADEAAARDHATVVAREVMRNSPLRTLTWRLQVCDPQRKPCFELLFASVCPELDHYAPEFRELVQRKSAAIATLGDGLSEVRHSLRQIRALLARADGMPHLAAVNGRRLDVAG